MFCLSALVYYHTVLQGTGEAWGFFQSIVVGLYRWMGFVPTFMFWLLVFAWCSVWFVTGRFERPWARLGWMTAFAISLALVVNLGTDGLAAPPHAGLIGTFLAVRLVSVFGVVFSALLALGAALASLFLATDFLFYRYFEALARGRGAAAIDPGVEPEATDAFRELAFAGIYGDQARANAEGATAQPRKRIVLEDESVKGFADAQLREDPIEDPIEVTVEVTAAADDTHAAASVAPADRAIPASHGLPETEEFDALWREASAPEAATSGESGHDDQEEPEVQSPEEGREVEDGDAEGDDRPWDEPVVELIPAAPAATPPATSAADAALYELPRPAAPEVPSRVDAAAREVLAAGRASVTLLRRRLGCSSAEAQDLLDELRDHGVVDGMHGAPQGGVATTLAQWEAR